MAYEGIEDCREAIIKSRKLADKVNLMHNRTGDDALGWGIGEYNAKGGQQIHTWKNGQMFEGILGLSMKYGATYATSWSMFENGGIRKGSDFSFIDGENMVPRPSYRHMEMVAKHFGGFFANGKSTSQDILAFGAVNGTKTSVMIMNRGNERVAYDLSLSYEDAIKPSNIVDLNADAGSSQKYTGKITALTTQTLVFEDGEVLFNEYAVGNFINETPPIESKIKMVGK